MFINNYDPLKGEVVRILDVDGSYNEDLEPKLSKEELKRLYYLMLLTKEADEKIVKLQRQGRMGTYGPSRGQEAIQVGSAFALKKEDWLFPAFRELGAHLTRGISIESNLLNWKGNEEGEWVPKNINDFTISIPVGSQIPQSVGAGMASKIKGDKNAVIVYFGDGATSEGDFHEGLNFAGVYNTPNVFVCQNNQFAISTPREHQTHSQTIAQKAIAYGFPGIIVDGNDILASYAVTKEALEHAKAGKGPVLIEALTYRFGPHTTADDPTKYRDKDEVEEWKKKDPIVRFRRYLTKKGILSKEEEQELRKKVVDEVNTAVKHVEEFPLPEMDDMFDFVYEELTHPLYEQKEHLRKILSDTEENNEEK